MEKLSKSFLFAVICFCATPFLAMASTHNYTCSDWNESVGGGGTGSCSADILTWVSGDKYFGYASSGYALTEGTQYYVTYTTSSGSGNFALFAYCTNVVGTHVNVAYGSGDGESTVTTTTECAEAPHLFVRNSTDGSGDGSGSGTLENVCISDVSYDECLGGGGGGGDMGSTTPAVAGASLTYHETLLILMLVILLISPIFWSFLFSPIKKT